MARLIPVFGIFLLLIAGIFSSGCTMPLADSGCGNKQVVGETYLLTKDRQQVKLTTPVADKNCHANMVLTYWYKDQSLAASGSPPPIKYEFQTLTGYFPAPVSKPDNYFLPGGVSVKAWTASVNQAAKNAPGEYTTYSVLVYYPRGTTDFPKDGVELSTEISYVPYVKK